MKVYWYNQGQTGLMQIRTYSEIYGLTPEIPNSSQIWVHVEATNHLVPEWFLKTSKGIVIPVASSNCKELRTVLLLQGIPCP